MYRLLFTLLLLAPLAHAQHLPTEARRLKVTDAEFGATPNNPSDDDSIAFNRALAKYAGKDTTVEVPCGAYHGSTQIDFVAARTSLAFEGACSPLTLKPGSPGFGDPANPRAFILTRSLNNSSNEAFQNNILLNGATIDCRGNPGARCVDFHGSNQAYIGGGRGTLRGDGPSVLYLGRAYPGPALVDELIVRGGRTAIELKHPQYSVTFRDVEVYDYTAVGLQVEGNVAFVDHFRAYSPFAAAVPISSALNSGYLALLGADLGCASQSRSAIEVSSGFSYVLNTVVSHGCGSALKDGVALVPGASIAELVSAPLLGNGGRTLGLQRVLPPPAWWSANPADWAHPLQYGCLNGVGGEGNDDTACIRAAVNSGRRGVYLPKKVTGDAAIFTLTIGGEILLPSTLQTFEMNGITLQIRAAAYPAGTCVFRVEGTAADPPLVIRYFRRQGGVGSRIGGDYFCVSGSRTVVFERLTSGSVRAVGLGKVFIKDSVIGVNASAGKNVYAWQHNSEGETTIISGAGTTFRDVGEKNETDFTVLRCENGAQCEVYFFGLPCVQTFGAPVASTAFIARNASLSVSGVQFCYSAPAAGKLYPIAVDHDGVLTPLGALVDVGGGNTNRRVLPLYSGHSAYEVAK